MELQYRVLGKVNNAFILRGLHFASGFNIDFCVTAEELPFVKERCEIKEVKEMKPKVAPQSPAIPNAVKESQNDKPRASTSSRSESANTAKVPVVTKRRD
jgi:hypothetical protein